MKKITPKQFKISMQALRDNLIVKEDDPESFHSSADELISLVMRQNGFEEGMDIFWNSEKWYA